MTPTVAPAINEASVFDEDEDFFAKREKVMNILNQ